MNNPPLFTEQDKEYMSRAIELAKKGLYSTKPNPAVGCVLVKDNVIVGEGWHRKAGMPHAEREALVVAADNARGATAYVTLEPCSHHGKTPPCADGLLEAGVSKVIVAMQDPNPLVSGNGIKKLQQAGVEVLTGLLEDEVKQLNLGFIHKMSHKLPYVRLKMASSLDGRTAMKNGESKWITGAESREEVHRMRAQAGALITGIGTVLADDPSLTVRLSDDQLLAMNLTQEDCHPLRVVLDPNLSMPLEAKMLSMPGRTVLMTSKDAAVRSPEIVEMMAAKQVDIVAVASDEDRLDIESILSYLAQEESVNDVMVESGAIVAGAFIESGYVNELHSFIAPSLMGHEAKPMFVLPKVQSMSEKIELKLKSLESFGNDVKMVFVPASTH